MQRRVFLAAAAAVWSQWAQASGLSALASFLADVKSGDVTFTQTIRPAGQADAPSQVLRGRMRFSRPDRFRFDYLTPYEQVIVADGQAIWLYDVDLAQVSVSDQKRTLANSPVGALLAAQDVASLQVLFELTEAPAREGLQWVRAQPSQKDAALVEAVLGFGAQGLARLEMVDAFGQRSSFSFDSMGMGQAVPTTVFQFVPPAEIDLIDQRRP